jgi:hypothetical protein
MRSIARAFKYLVYFAQANTPELRKEAAAASKVYYNENPNLRTIDNVISFRRGFISTRCRKAARDRISFS